MKAHREFIVVMSLAVVMMQPSLAAAQLSSAEASNWGLPFAVGQKVTVTTAEGRKVTGQVLSLSPATVDIGKDGSVTTSLAFAEVQRVQVIDSVANGVWTGAITLGLVGALWGLLGDATSDFASVIFTGKQDDSNYTLIGTLVGASAGALLGYAIDASKLKTIYQREASGLSVGLRPIVSNAGKGIGVRVRW